MFLSWFDVGLILFSGIVFGFLYAWYDRKHQRIKIHFLNTIISSFPGSFFFQPQKNGMPICSKNLCLSLNLSNQHISWKELVTHFDSNDALSLNQAFNQIQTQHTPVELTVHSANHIFTFHVQCLTLTHGNILVTFQDISSWDTKSEHQQKLLDTQKKQCDLLANALENLPFPLFIRDNNGKNMFANQAVNQTAKSLNDMDWLSLPFESNQQFFTMTYGQETKTEAELKIILNKMIAAHRRLCKELPTPVCLFNAKGALMACSKSFADLWHLNQTWIDSSPSFAEYWDVVQEQGLLSRVADFAGYKKQQTEQFARLSQSSELFLYLPDGRLIRRVMIPYVQGSVIILDEITSTNKK